MTVEPRLLVDLRVGQHESERGVPRYSQALTLTLAREHPDIKISCLVDSRRPMPSLTESLRTYVQIVEGTPAIPREGPFTHFLQTSIFDSGKPIHELFPPELGTFHPRLGAVVYDLIPALFPDAYLTDPVTDRWFRTCVAALDSMDRLFAISESVRSDVIALAGVDPWRVVTINGGAGPIDSPKRALPREGRAVGAKGSIPATPGYWLYVGGDDFRKNLQRLIEATGILKRTYDSFRPVVIVCAIEPHRRRELFSVAKSVGLVPNTDIYVTGLVSDETLTALYAGCLGVVFPSLYEGLGLPILEAYTLKRPVLASNTSSMRELVPEECQFDPFDTTSIAAAMARFVAEPALRERSVQFAPDVLARHDWSRAAAALAGWIDGHPDQRRADSKALRVVSPLPPAKSGVGYYLQRSLAAPSKPVTFFAATRSHSELLAARQAIAEVRHQASRLGERVDVLSIEGLHVLRAHGDREPVMFALGNSDHHAPTLRYVLSEHVLRADVAFLADVYLGNLLWQMYGSKDELGRLLGEAYAAVEFEPWLDLLEVGAPEASQSGVLGARLLTTLGGFRRFIVTSDSAEARLRSDLGDHATTVDIQKIFLQVLPPLDHVRRPTTHELTIGHFGIIGPAKQPERLIAACDLLARSRPLRLILAGYEVKEYLAEHRLRRNYQYVVEAPSDAELEALMSQVDCAVQLRFPDHGESSGVVNQLLSLRKPVVCTSTGAFRDLEGVVRLVPPDIPADSLAEMILLSVGAGWTDLAEAYVENRSITQYEAALRELVLTGHHTH